LKSGFDFKDKDTCPVVAVLVNKKKHPMALFNMKIKLNTAS
jgi:hypothetical protein